MATSSVELNVESESSAKCLCSASTSLHSSSRLSMRPTVTTEKRPRHVVTVMGCDSVSEMTPMPMREPSKRGRSGSNLLRKYAFSMLWMERTNFSPLKKAMPARLVPKCEW